MRILTHVYCHDAVALAVDKINVLLPLFGRELMYTVTLRHHEREVVLCYRTMGDIVYSNCCIATCL